MGFISAFRLLMRPVQAGAAEAKARARARIAAPPGGSFRMRIATVLSGVHTLK